MIERDFYLQQLIDRKENGLIKIITGIRRCGKSYLLDPIFRQYLEKSGVPKDHIIKIELDTIENVKFYDNPVLSNQYVLSLIKDDSQYYVLLDEIQKVKGFELVLNGLLYKKNIDVYVTGSNSKFLSTDIITEFRGRGDQIHVRPLSFSEYSKNYDGDLIECWNNYIQFGGMPLVFSMKTDEAKSKYLKDLFEYTYFKDIVERYNIKREDSLGSLVNVLASSVGSLTNPKRISDTFLSNGENDMSLMTTGSYLSHLEEAFIIEKTLRYDVKGRKYIGTPQKYYFSDLGLRNARLNFRQLEEGHLMENAIFNELLFRGYNVDVGMVEIRNKNNRIQTEIDFVCNQGSKRYYIQSSLDIESREKTIQESRPFLQINDNFKKIIVVKGFQKPWYTEEGIQVIGVINFLSDFNSLDK